MVLEMTYPQLERAVNPTHDIRLFSGRSNPKLAQEIADYLGTTVGPMVIKNFADGEIYVPVSYTHLTLPTMFLSFNRFAIRLTKTSWNSL